jgi:hypothetical protein
MFRALRTRMHVSPATAIATLALVFAMGGGAYAAGRYVITSTRQISPKVLKSLKGADGKNGAMGPAGATGAAGPGGPAGPQGPGGPQGPAGATGPAGTNGTNGKNGTNGTTGFTEKLPSDKTETGAWALSPSAEGLALTAISFNIPLAHELSEAQVHFVAETPITECPGTAARPTALPGNLCVYQGEGFLSLFHLKFESINTYSNGGPGAGTAGAFLYFEAEAVEPGEPRIGNGSWAVTAE